MTQNDAEEAEDNVLLVGLGASAGGLDALKQFFSSLPEEPGMAFIVVIHLPPDHESKMAELLQRQTTLPVRQVTGRTEVESDHVYVIPPNKFLSVEDHHLNLTDPDDGHGLATVDLFFRRLAAAKGRYAASIVLSGTGTDGSVGMKAIKEEGGLAMVQDPADAAYPGMPESAINTGLADVILSAGDMVGELLAYKKNLDQICISETDEGLVQEILKIVEGQTGHDFSNYKRSSVRRRIQRRMQVKHSPKLSDYLSFLQEEPGEARELLKDLLISVTSFFRDPEAFEALAGSVIPALFKEKGPDDQLRIWVPGCATGEEAYSIAMLVRDQLRHVERPPEIKIFASDIDAAALEIGRRGVYPESIAADVKKTYLRRYFDKQDHQYRLSTDITEMVLFAPHNLLRDPPFSNLDLITCRNLMIYLRRDIQSEVFKLLHYALRPGGWLFLGQSDSNLEAGDLFTPVDKEHRIYRRNKAPASRSSLPQMPLQFTKNRLASQRDQSSFRPRRRQTSDAEILHHELLARLYAPPGVVIDGSYRIIHATNGIQDFLEYSGGELSKNIMSMIKPELRQALRSLLFNVTGNGSPARQMVTIKSGQGGSKTREKESVEGRKEIEITVHHISNSDYPEGLFHVAFQRLGGVGIEHHVEQEVSQEETQLVDALEAKLEQRREQLQVSTEEYETSIEELRSSNEELQSMNEELQSTTEELETSQEELQSVNEELKTVNQQLESKVEKLRRANSDLKNLMEATHIGILFLDREFCLQRFTSAATDIFNLTAADLGRPLDHFTHRLEYNSLNDDLSRALEKLEKIRKVVSSRDGRRYVMRLRPYQSTEDKIEGVVLTFVDITELHEARRQLARQRKQESLAALGIYALEQADLGSILHRALQQLCIGLEADYALLLSWDPGTNRLQLQDQTGWEPDKDQPTTFDADKKWDAAYALWDEKPVVTANYGREKRFNPSPAVGPLETASGIQMRVAGSGSAWGVVGLYAREPRQYSQEDITFIQVVANMLGIAIERTKTKEALEEEVKRSKRYQRQILNNSIVDRWNVGGYLHDELAQQLATIKIFIDSIKAGLEHQGVEIPPDFTTVLQLIIDSISSIRNLSHDIIPIDIEAEGVRAALQFLAHELESRHNIRCLVEQGPIVDEIKNRKVATNLYLIIQEAIKNAIIHGKARQVRILIKQEGDELLMQITDDGKGFSDTAWDKERAGSGVNIMQHRVELHGGKFKIEGITDSQKSGTRVSCRLPVRYLKKEEE